MNIPLNISRKTQSKLDNLGLSAWACAQGNTVYVRDKLISNFEKKTIFIKICIDLCDSVEVIKNLRS